MVWLFEVTNTLAASLPLNFKLIREYCPVERYSVRWPAAVLLNGMAQKFVAVTLPVLVVRKIFSKSTNPPGVKSVLPMRKDSGDSFGFSVSCTTVALTGVATVRMDASATWGVPDVLFSSCCSRVWICCCCWEICFCCWLIASRNAFSSSATDPVPAEPLFVAVAWPRASPEASTTKHIFSNNLIELFLLCFFVVYRPIKVIIPAPCCLSQLRNQMVAETRVSISHHICVLVHTYVQGSATPWSSQSFQIWKKTEA